MYWDQLPHEVKIRPDLKAFECERCRGRGRYDRNYLGDCFTDMVQCMKCGGNGYIIRKKCPECGEFSLLWGDAPDTCDECGYEKPAHRRYKQAFPEQFEKEGNS